MKLTMKIKTITCHDVYNAGAGLQAFALQKYLSDCGHEVEIIDYKPEYLSRHYSLRAVNNPRYRKPVLRQLYILAKLPKRMKRLKSEKKIRFDEFRKNCLVLTQKRYRSFRQLKNSCPEADLYIAGSDQIWNPLFPNGKDPAFFLDFVPEGKKKVSYAASFSVAAIDEEERIRIGDYLKKFDHISVRESSALKLLEEMHVSGTQVCDPVFLPDEKVWRNMAVPYSAERPYIFVYDFDRNSVMHEKIREFAGKEDLNIVSAFPFEGGTYLPSLGPLEFLGVIANAHMVISNSFHATAFSILFHIPFAVFHRKEALNIRMTDLLESFGCMDTALIDENHDLIMPEMDWNELDQKRIQLTEHSREYLDQCTETGENR